MPLFKWNACHGVGKQSGNFMQIHPFAHELNFWNGYASGWQNLQYTSYSFCFDKKAHKISNYYLPWGFKLQCYLVSSFFISAFGWLFSVSYFNHKWKIHSNLRIKANKLCTCHRGIQGEPIKERSALHKTSIAFKIQTKPNMYCIIYCSV